VQKSPSPTDIYTYTGLSAEQNPRATASSELGLLNFRDGEVEESHRSQPVLQGPQKWHQEAKEAPPHFHQRGNVFIILL
jgi:hypothetical protein